MSRYQRTMRDALQSVADGQMEFDEAVKWEVKISGLPTFYADGKSKGEVKMMLRKLLKRPDEIVSIERTTPAALKISSSPTPMFKDSATPSSTDTA